MMNHKPLRFLLKTIYVILVFCLTVFFGMRFLNRYQSGETSEDGTPIHSHEWEWAGGSADTDQQGYHTHEINQWMPRINDRVLVLMEYGFNASGYILGVIP